MLNRERIARDGIFDPAYIDQYCLTPPTREAGRQGFRNNMLFMIVLSTTFLMDRFVHSRPSAPSPAAAAQRLRVIEYQT